MNDKDTDKKIKKDKGAATIVLFSGELDKAIAAFVVATSAASMGMKTSIFFTFWGLNIIKKPGKRTLGRSIMEKMLNFMNYGHAGKLKMSKMNMGGAGPAMLKMMMGQRKVPSLPEFLELSRELGIKFYPCEMSMTVMGLKKEDFVDGCEDIIGAVSYLSLAKDSEVNLFI